MIETFSHYCIYVFQPRFLNGYHVFLLEEGELIRMCKILVHFVPLLKYN